MSEECSQYLAQLHKDWERRRIKLGVEAIRREVANTPGFLKKLIKLLTDA